MKSVKYEVEYGENAGRLELFIRWVWAIPTYFVMVVLAILAGIAIFVQWFHILILGKRNKTLMEWTKIYMSYIVKFQSYLMLLTDERNPILPES